MTYTTGCGFCGYLVRYSVFVCLTSGELLLCTAGKVGYYYCPRRCKGMIFFFCLVPRHFFVLSYFLFGCHTILGKERWRRNFWLHRLLGRSERQDRGTFNPRRLERHSVLLRIEGLL